MKLATLFILFIFSLNINTYAQSDWAKMTSKQKVKLAKKEQKSAKKDPEYLKMMEEALLFFQDNLFDQAKEKYTQAHNRRPDNVYPMVMLDDIEVAMESALVIEQTEEELYVEDIIEKEIIDEEITTPEEKEVTVIEEEEAEEISIFEEEEIVEEPVSILVPPVKEKEISKTKLPEENSPNNTTIIHPTKVYAEDGVYREDLKEGNAKIDQITIIEKGVATVYRKVSHAWGAVYYFQNEEPITAAEWNKILVKIETN
jgi:hypothetical protein